MSITWSDYYYNTLWSVHQSSSIYQIHRYIDTSIYQGAIYRVVGWGGGGGGVVIRAFLNKDRWDKKMLLL